MISRCDLLVHCDATFDNCEEVCDAMAMKSLGEGGLLARLWNMGSRESVPDEMLRKGPQVLRGRAQAHIWIRLRTRCWARASM